MKTYRSNNRSYSHYNSVATRFHRLTGGLFTEGRSGILLAVSGGWALSIGVRFVYPALVPYFRPKLGMSLSAVGLLLTLLWGAYAVGHIPGGMLGDSLGEGNLLVISMIVAALTVGIVAGAINVWMLFVGTVGFGVASALYGPTRFTILSDIYPDRSGSAIGLTMAAGSVGNAAFPVLATTVATILSWRYGFGLFFPLFLIALWSIWSFVPHNTSPQTTASDSVSIITLQEILNLLKRSSFRAIVTVQVCLSFVIQGFTSFYPQYLVSIKDITPRMAALLLSLFFISGAVIQPISGRLVDSFGLRYTLGGFLVSCTAGLWVLQIVDSLLFLVLGTVLFSSWNGCPVVTQTYIVGNLPKSVQGTGFGIIKAGWMVVGATSPLIIGVLGDFGYFSQGFFILVLIGSSSLIILVKYVRLS